MTTGTCGGHHLAMRCSTSPHPYDLSRTVMLYSMMTDANVSPRKHGGNECLLLAASICVACIYENIEREKLRVCTTATIFEKAGCSACISHSWRATRILGSPLWCQNVFSKREYMYATSEARRWSASKRRVLEGLLCYSTAAGNVHLNQWM